MYFAWKRKLTIKIVVTALYFVSKVYKILYCQAAKLKKVVHLVSVDDVKANSGSERDEKIPLDAANEVKMNPQSVNMTSESGKKSKMILESGHTVEEVSEEEQAQIAKEFKAYKLGMIRLQPGGWLLLKSFVNYANRLYNFKCRPNDVFVLTFPKSGTTWMQEIIWTMRNNPNLNNPLDYLPVIFKSPEFDFDFITQNPCWSEDKSRNKDPLKLYMSFYNPEVNCDGQLGLQYANQAKDPRTLKSHLPLSLMPKDVLETSKVVYVARNPKDVCVSYHHHCELVKFDEFVGTMDQFIDRFVKDSLQWSPYWTHVKEAWAKRNHPNMHFVFYEDFKADPKSEIKRLDNFLGTNLIESQIDNVVSHTSFEVMKYRDFLVGEDSPFYDEEVYFKADVRRKKGGFFRKGEVGDFKNKLTKEQEAKIDVWMNANTTGDGPEYKWESLSERKMTDGPNGEPESSDIHKALKITTDTDALENEMKEQSSEKKLYPLAIKKGVLKPMIISTKQKPNSWDISKYPMKTGDRVKEDSVSPGFLVLSGAIVLIFTFIFNVVA